MGTIPPTTYFDSLIDDFGIWQHTEGGVILRREGYALDDAARGLLLTLARGSEEQSEVLLNYILKSRVGNGYYGFADENRHFIPASASDDATGQTIWAAGFAISKGFHVQEAARLIKEVTPYFDTPRHMRGYAYALLGAMYVSVSLADYYYEKLRIFFDGRDDDWPWPESTLTYGNGIIPYVFLRYGHRNNDAQSTQLGRKILLFLEEKCTHNRTRGPIGNDGWFERGSDVVPTYSQQPIDAAYMMWAWLSAYEQTGDMADRLRAEEWMRWFEGDNVAGAIMYDPEDMRCFDGIDPQGVHKNSGAESNICLLLSKLMFTEHGTI